MYRFQKETTFNVVTITRENNLEIVNKDPEYLYPNKRH